MGRLYQGVQMDDESDSDTIIDSDIEDEQTKIEEPRCGRSRSMISPMTPLVSIPASTPCQVAPRTKRQRGQSPEQRLARVEDLFRAVGGRKNRFKSSVPKFNGRTDVESWETRFLLAIRQYEDPEERFEALAGSLEEDALQHFLAHYKGREEWSVQRWLKNLRVTFPPNCEQKEEVIRARRYKKGEDTPEGFVKRTLSLIKDLDCCMSHWRDRMDILQDTMVDHPSYERLCTPIFPGTPGELIGRLKNAEKKPLGTLAMKPKVKATVNLTSETQGESEESKEKRELRERIAKLTDMLQPDKSDGLADLREQVNKLAEHVERRNRRRDDIQCFNCRQWGHYQNQCPRATRAERDRGRDERYRPRDDSRERREREDRRQERRAKSASRENSIDKKSGNLKSSGSR